MVVIYAEKTFSMAPSATPIYLTEIEDISLTYHQQASNQLCGYLDIPP